MFFFSMEKRKKSVYINSSGVLSEHLYAGVWPTFGSNFSIHTHTQPTHCGLAKKLEIRSGTNSVQLIGLWHDFFANDRWLIHMNYSKCVCDSLTLSLNVSYGTFHHHIFVLYISSVMLEFA